MADVSPVSMMVYCNGAFVSASEASLPIDDPGVLYGFGFFETLRTSGGRLHQWARHRARLERACIVAGLRVPESFLAFDERALSAAVQRLLREHGMADAVFRYTLTGAPAEILTLRALPPAPPTTGIALRVLALARDSGEWLPRPKSLNYLNALSGAQELRNRSADTSDEGLFLTRDSGCVVETARQNVAWIGEGVLRYPDLSLGAVNGTCLEWMLGLGISAKSRRAALAELLSADAIFVTNAVRGITPVREIYDREDRLLRGGIGSNEHPVVVSLMRQWNEALERTARS